ncbi:MULTISPECIES: hypothetical protein [unclassified Pseudoalteromonas]|uniref:hypothetical protein n=1 Tax=unclassified Pseudoalteromonas TaxID=194690 RepID=UPI001F41622D|nr:MULTISPECIES: hypothetical protein [unclassified Pseudoalteromonas]MCF2825984.1 hypothetical protein [Pseudoalteromonas sp. OF5H-5]MCF2830006.1 hypothetical protein [Pseudoalteromonas sp. DL2-H6]MCF2925357.1 hypothetical protein [Pseudoalteromonas sp. DL2-H1]
MSRKSTPWQRLYVAKKYIVAATLYREETHRSSGFYVAEKHIVAATLCRDQQ